jgi:hypothetical protein
MVGRSALPATGVEIPGESLPGPLSFCALRPFRVWTGYCLLTAVLVAAGTSAAGGERARFLFELNGVPVGTVELTLDGAEYRYTSTHLFARGRDRKARVRSAAFQLGEGRRDARTGVLLESLWLWKRPTPGCEIVRSELEARSVRACVFGFSGSRAAGTLGQEAFTAEYEGEELRVLALGVARFTREDPDSDIDMPRPPDMFSEGWPIAGARGALRLEPTWRQTPRPEKSASDRGRRWRSTSDARALAKEIHHTFAEDRGATCIDLVRAFADRAAERHLGHVEVVHGLVAEPGAVRAWPHAWVRVRSANGPLEIDPTLQIPVTSATHLAIARVPFGDESGDAGRAWLALAESPRIYRARER